MGFGDFDRGFSGFKATAGSFLGWANHPKVVFLKALGVHKQHLECWMLWI